MNYKKTINIKNVFIKDESKNPFGTFKDRRSKFIVKKALENNVSKLCLITSGNAGFSLAKMSKPKGIKVVCIVDKNLKKSIKNKLKKASYQLIEQDLSKKVLHSKQIIALARGNKKEKIWDVTNGYSEAYEEIIKELKHLDFNYLICPVGSGEAFIGLYRGLKNYNIKAKLIGVSVRKCPSAADKLATIWTPYKQKIDSALKQGNTLVKLTEKEVLDTYKTYKNKLKCEPSSAVVWATFNKINFNPKDRLVILNSGRGLV